MVKIILLASNTAGIGKSTFAKTLQKTINTDGNLYSRIESFAGPIKFMTHRLHQDFEQELLIIPPISFEDFAQGKKNDPIEAIESKYTPRDLTIKVSDFLQDIYGKSIWSKVAINNINYFHEMEKTQIFIFDDWRRPIESEFFKSFFGEDKVTTVYLTKADIKESSLNVIGNTYEGLLKPEDCDIQFEFNSDWSNTEDLIRILDIHPTIEIETDV